jgi:hypothetical protein
MDRETKVTLALGAGWILGTLGVVAAILFWGT